MAADSALIALSSASGPSRMPPVIWPRSAILHSAAASTVDGIFGLTVSTARQDRDAHLGEAQRVAEIDRVLHDVDLVLEGRRDVDRGVRDDQRLLVGRHVEHEAVADAARGAQPGVALHHLPQQLVGVQAPLHQRLGPAARDLLHRLRGGGVAVGRLHQLAAREVQLQLLRRRLRSSRAGRPGSAGSDPASRRRRRRTARWRRTGGRPRS